MNYYSEEKLTRINKWFRSYAIRTFSHHPDGFIECCGTVFPIIQNWIRRKHKKQYLARMRELAAAWAIYTKPKAFTTKEEIFLERERNKQLIKELYQELKKIPYYIVRRTKLTCSRLNAFQILQRKLIVMKK